MNNMDDELGLVYYNYRHLNPLDGRWISRDPIEEEGGWNLFAFAGNKIFNQSDILGLICTIEYSIKLHTILIRKVDKDGNIVQNMGVQLRPPQQHGILRRLLQ